MAPGPSEPQPLTMVVAEPLEQQPPLTVGQELQGQTEHARIPFPKETWANSWGWVFLFHFVWLLFSVTDVPILSLHHGAWWLCH